MSWQDRLRPSIVLTSPGGSRFEASWRGGEISVSKRIQRTAHPDRDGETLDDLGLNSPDLPLAFFFSGADHDIRSLEFSHAIAERGVWTVVHPVYGDIKLQPAKVSIAANPVESGNITEISGEWILADLSAHGSSVLSPSAPAAARPTPAARLASPPRAPDPRAAVEAAAAAASESALADAGQISSRATASAAATQGAAAQIRAGLNTFKGAIRSANSRITAIMGTINDLSLRPYLDIASISGAVIQLAESPGLFLGSVAGRIALYIKLGKRIITGLPAAGQFSVDQIAAAMSGELWLNAVLCGIGTTITDGLPETRAEALYILRQYRYFASQSQDALDALAKATRMNTIGGQYFPRASSAEAILTLNAAISRYILNAAFNLKTEKSVTLSRPESPLIVTLREYGCPAADVDKYFDLFCRSNGLHGRELLLLPAGKEVVVYA
jgi:hypothetical protein